MSLRDIAYARDIQFSQFGEDLFVRYYFGNGKKAGFYVDIGAYHPFQGSNTYHFYKSGWRGINIEPNPIMFPSFPRHRENDINLNLAVSNHEGFVDFNCDGVYSGIASSADNAGKTVHRVATAALASILENHLPFGQQIDFMSIDCEGHDLIALQSNDWERFTPKLIIVEDHSTDSTTPIESYLTSLGYKSVIRLGMSKVFESTNR